MTTKTIKIKDGEVKTIIEDERSKNHKITINAGENSNVDYAICVNSEYTGTYEAHLGKNAKLNWYFIGDIQGDNTISICTVHECQGSDSQIYLIINARKNGKVRIELINDHQKESSTGSINIRAIGGDHGAIDMDGMIKIGEHAHGVKSFLKFDSLLTSENSRIRAIPNLEILNNDVEAFHSATVGSLNDEAIDYMVSRGLTRLQAEKLIRKGFLQALINKISNKVIREKFLKLIK